MGKYILIPFIILLHFFALAQKVEVKKSVREIRFVNLMDEGNEPFMRKRHELTRFICDAIKKGFIKPYSVDYNASWAVKELSLKEWDERLLIPTEDEYIVNTLFPLDLYIIGVDITSGIFKTEVLREKVTLRDINFFHFYLPKEFAPSGKPEYIFSINWPEFMEYFKKNYEDELYYENKFSTWWKGDVHLTHDDYYIDEGLDACSLFPKIIRSGNLDSIDLPLQNDITACELFMVEKAYNNVYDLTELGVETITKDDKWGKGEHFTFDWIDIKEAIEDSIGNDEKEPMLMWYALHLHKFVYATAYDPVMISKKGKFLHGGKDTLGNKAYLFNMCESCYLYWEDTLTTTYLEYVDMSNDLNKHLHDSLNGLVPLIIEYLKEQKLVPYEYDSLKNVVAYAELQQRLKIQLPYGYYLGNEVYKKGDTVEYKNNYYSAKKDMDLTPVKWELVEDDTISTESWDDPFFFYSHTSFKVEDWKLLDLNIPYYDPHSLNIFEPTYYIYFDVEGENKEYDLQGIGLYVPYDHEDNIRGIQLPICFVKWDALKKLLLQDDRAYTTRNDKKAHLTDVIENRDFFAYFLKTGVLELAE